MKLTQGKFDQIVNALVDQLNAMRMCIRSHQVIRPAVPPQLCVCRRRAARCAASARRKRGERGVRRLK